MKSSPLETEMNGVVSAARPGDDIFIGLGVYDVQVVNEISRIPGAKADGRRWRVPYSQAHAAAKIAEVYGLRKIGHLPESRIGGSDGPISIPNGKLMQHQDEGVRILEGFGHGSILGDDMGVGKTLTALAMAWHRQSWPMVIVCPEILRSNWSAEAKRFLKIAPRILTGSRANHALLEPQAKMYLIGYSVLGGWAEALAAISPKLLVFDESHYLKNSAAKRSRSAAALARASEAVIAMSGTMVVNRPEELMHQLKLVGRLDDVGGEKFYLERYCGSRERVTIDPDGKVRKRWVRGAADPERLAELNRRLRATCYLRRELREVISNLPDMHLFSQMIEAQDLTRYREEERKLEEAGRGDWNDRNVRAQANASVASMRKELGLQKMVPGVEWIRNLAASTDEKILVFFHHRQVGEEISSRLGCKMIYGGMSQTMKDKALQEFKTGSDQILALSLSVGNVGLNLTEATRVVFLEFPWTPSEMEQGAARAMRNGQTKDVHVWLLAAASTVEDIITEKLVDKVEVTSLVNSGRYNPGVIAALIREGVIQ